MSKRGSDVGTVIKAGTFGKLQKRLETLALKDHMAEAQSVVQAACDEASRIVESARREAVKIRGDAQQSGYETGYAQGLDEGEHAGRADAAANAHEVFRGQHAQLISSITVMLHELEVQKEGLLERAERDLLHFAVCVAERITKRTGILDHETVVANTRAAIEEIGVSTGLAARVHPSDMEALRRFASELNEELTHEHHLRLIEDDGIEPGGCIVSSAVSRVDATLETQFRRAAAVLLGENADAETSGRAKVTLDWESQR